MKKFAVMLTLALNVLGNSAEAADRSFDFLNDSGDQVAELYVSHVGTSRWGRDVLGANVLDDGEQIRVEPDQAFGYCRFDIKIVFANRSEPQILSGVNLCSATSITTKGARRGWDGYGYYHDVDY